ncbi:MAG: hypothetical protein ACI4PL_01745 [Faecousia sp.]
MIMKKFLEKKKKFYGGSWGGELLFSVTKYAVVANQRVRWCGNPPKGLGLFSFRFPILPGDCHASVRTGSQ